MKKKLLVLMLAFAMTLAFAACGGGGGGSDSGAAEESVAEPNTGVEGIVFVVPDDWPLENASTSGGITYKVPDSDFQLYASIFDEESLESINQWNPERGAGSVQEYYDKYYTSEEALSKENLENTAVKVCDTDAQYNKYKADSGEYLELGTYWMYEGKIYNIGMFNPDAYGDSGEVVQDAAKLTDDEIAAYEDIIASVQPGDGASMLKALMKADSIGSIAFEAPEGYTLTDVYSDFISFTKDGSDITLQINRSDESSLQYMEKEDGTHPSSLKEWYENFLFEGVEETTIAGYEGHIDKYTAEDDKYHNVNAEFLTDDAIYSVNMGTDAWDEEGNLKPDATVLSEDDIAVFDAFVASLKQK